MGTLEDTAAERLLTQKGIRKKVYGNQVEPYLDLGLERIDAVLLDLPIAIYYARPNPKLKFVGKPLGEGFYAIAFRKDQEALAERFDAALGRLLDSGAVATDLREMAPLERRPGEAGRFPARLGRPGGSGVRRRDQPVEPQVHLLLLHRRLVGRRRADRADHVRRHGPGDGHRAADRPGAALRPAAAALAATVYVEFFRGIPVLLLLFFLYYGLPAIVRSYYRCLGPYAEARAPCRRRSSASA